MIKVLVVGGAGYIGSHMCKYLRQKGYQPIVVDNLVCGHEQAVRWGPFYRGSMSDRDLLGEVLSDHNIQAVMHFAAHCYVGESVLEPMKYYENNVGATVRLLGKLVERDNLKVIFSSSCATYGEPAALPITETHPLNPINPYGRTKLMVEQILEDFHRAYGLNFISLRYFNAAGADPEEELGEVHDPETHLIPLVLQTALGQRPAIEIFGEDYPTKDGTCIRDYIHVNDLAQAHLLALERLLSGKEGGCYNLGNGNGYSVKEVVDLATEITKMRIPIKIGQRRCGDPAILISSSKRARSELGWSPMFSSLEKIVESAWQWHRTHPRGYGA
jgi:UDP-glucose 4-epimerase